MALPLLLVNIDTNGFAQLSESFGANSILYGYENPRAVGWASTIFLSLLAAYVSTLWSCHGLVPVSFEQCLQ